MTWHEDYEALIEAAGIALFRSLCVDDPDEVAKWRARAGMLEARALQVKAEGDRRSKPKTGPGSVGYRPFRAQEA